MEKERPMVRIQTSEEIPTGTFCLVLNDIMLYGSLTDLTDNLFAGGMIMKILKDGTDANIIVNQGDWDNNREFIV